MPQFFPSSQTFTPYAMNHNPSNASQVYNLSSSNHQIAQSWPKSISAEETKKYLISQGINALYKTIFGIEAWIEFFRLLFLSIGSQLPEI
jgi:hypothetical protein